MYLQTYQIPAISLNTKDPREIARQIVSLMEGGHNWVKLTGTSVPGCENTWTVLDRDENGKPVNVAYDEFDGSQGVIKMSSLWNLLDGESG